MPTGVYKRHSHMMRVLVVNDIHAAASPPMGCTDLYPSDILNMLREARDYAISEQCEYTVITGDTFHAKRNTPYWLVRELMEIFASWPGRKLAIVGNHDLGYEGLASIPKQPIGVLFEAGVLEWLKDDLVVTSEDGVIVQFSPANYTDTLDHNPFNFGLERQDGVDWAVKVSHGSLTPPGKPFPYHTVPIDTVPTEGLDLVLNGHLHTDSGIQEVNDCTFACLGSLGRTQNNEDNRERQMRLLMVEFTKKTMDCTELPLLSAAKAEDLFLIKQGGEVEVSKAMQAFVRNIESATRLEEGSLDEVVARIGGDSVDGRAKLRLVQYLDKAGING